ncbi:MAG: 50S ribosomal protein L3 N(5)-glutamine methyltransferase [Gammaproteobacteria bacterium]
MKSPPLASPATVGDLIEWGEKRLIEAEVFFGHGADCALDEAAFLALTALGLPLATAGAGLKQVVSEKQREQVARLVEQRIETRQPAAYLVHEAWFAGLPFYVDQRVLVPRSPISELIGSRFSPWLSKHEELRILDLGTGSGCIAVACARAFPDSRIDATDVSQDALQVARINLQRHGLEHRIRLHESDVFSALPQHAYDIIVSNPPYVPEPEIKKLPPEYRAEPKLGMGGGADGLQIVRRLLTQSAAYLAETGILIVEVGHQEKGLQQAYPDVPFLWLEFEKGGQGVFLLEASELRLHFPRMDPRRPQ